MENSKYELFNLLLYFIQIFEYFFEKIQFSVNRYNSKSFL